MSSGLIDIVRELIQIAQNSEEEYRGTACKVQDLHLKQSLEKKADICHKAVLIFQQKLEEIININEANDKPAEISGSEYRQIYEIPLGKDSQSFLVDWEPKGYTA